MPNKLIRLGHSMNFMKLFFFSLLEFVVHSIMLLVPRVLVNFPETHTLGTGDI
jgi:hypothetical protein